MTRNIKLTLEFDGTAYAGWQVQPEQATVQGTLIHAIERLTGEKVRLTGVGRTDAGVHALAYVANFSTISTIGLKGIRDGLNTLLPEDIAVMSVEEPHLDFNANASAKSKTYLYKVFNGDYRTPLNRHRAWSVSWPLDVEEMRRGAALMVGEQDFTSFCATRSDVEHCVREVLSVDIEEAGSGYLHFTVKGRGFLRHMVRIMVGTLVTVGRGKLSAGDVSKIIEARDRTVAPYTAPPEGLYLLKVEY